MEKDHLEILLEDIRGKFDLVLEGHEVLRKEIRGVRDDSNVRHEHTAFLITALNNKIDNVETRLSARIDGVETKLTARIDGVETSLTARINGVESTLGAKIDAVAGDLAAHRKDTEAHGAVWRVKEGKE